MFTKVIFTADHRTDVARSTRCLNDEATIVRLNTQVVYRNRLSAINLCWTIVASLDASNGRRRPDDRPRKSPV